MSDTKILQAILDGQKALEERLVSRIDKVGKVVNEVKVDLQSVEKNLTKRINKLGRQIAFIEDDSPTIEEFDKLEGRVSKLENRSIKN